MRHTLILVTIGVLLSMAGRGEAQPAQIQATTTPLIERDAAHAGTSVRAALQVRLGNGLHVQSNKPRDPSLIPTVLTVNPPSGVTVSELVFPTPTDLKQAGQAEPLAVFEQQFSIGVQLVLAKDIQPGELVVPARLRYQACDESMCYVPKTVDVRWTLRVVAADVPEGPARTNQLDAIPFGHGEAPPAAAPAAATSPIDPGRGNAGAELDDFSVLATTGGYLGTADFLQFIHNAETGVRETGLFEGRGPLAILLLVLVGGLALNLTPCVLPMIPINLAIIGAGAQAGSRARGLLLGTAYGGAMAVVYGVLGLIVILTAGTFGVINSSPWFNVGIAAIFIVLGLAMFDVLFIDFSRFSSGFHASESSRSTFLLAFTMGAVAALLAGACVAPVVIQVVLFSSSLYATGTKLALALPFFLGIGMALPWPLAGAGLASLPRPGAWMIRVKQAFGVLILGTAVYYGYVAYDLFSQRWVDPTAVASSVQKMIKGGWHATLADGLATAKREQKPVLIDLWATWCKNCLTMDETTLASDDVTSALAGYVKIKFQAEQPDEPPASDVMKRFNAIGLPTYVILRPKEPASAP